jgi:sugar/nucleoside kinase (ribokinase family)
LPANPAAWTNQTLWAPAFVVNVAGTTGAGDAAIAGFLGGLLRGLGPQRALCMAAAVGACNVEAADSLSGLRSWEATLARVEAGWHCRDLKLAPEEWEWSEKNRVWSLL